MLRVEPIIHTAFNKSPIGAYIRPHIFCRASFCFFRRRMESPGKTHSTLPYVLYCTMLKSTYTELHNMLAYRLPTAPNQLRQIPIPNSPPILISQIAQAGTQPLQTVGAPPDLCFRDKLGNPPPIYHRQFNSLMSFWNRFSRLHPHLPVASESNRRLSSALETPGLRTTPYIHI